MFVASADPTFHRRASAFVKGGSVAGTGRPFRTSSSKSGAMLAHDEHRYDYQVLIKETEIQYNLHNIDVV